MVGEKLKQAPTLVYLNYYARFKKIPYSTIPKNGDIQQLQSIIRTNRP